MSYVLQRKNVQERKADLCDKSTLLQYFIRQLYSPVNGIRKLET